MKATGRNTGSKRQENNNKRAQKVCRELRYILARDGMVNGNNADQLLKLLESWMRTAKKEKYIRP